MRLFIVFLCCLLHAVFAAPQFITFKDGKIGVNFGGYHADAGLGGLLTGDAAHGGLSASAGTPWGPQAAAGLGGNLDGRTSGVAYAGAQANPSVGASAVLAGTAGEHGIAGSEAHANGKIASNTITRHHQHHLQSQRDVIPVTSAPPTNPIDNSIQKIKPPKKYSLIRNDQFHSHSNENRNIETTINGDNISTVAFDEIFNENTNDDTVAAASTTKSSSKTATITTVVKQQPPPPPPLPVYDESYNGHQHPHHHHHHHDINDNDSVNDGKATIHTTNYENSNDDGALPWVIVKHRHHLRHHERHEQRKRERELLRQQTQPRIRQRVKIIEKNIELVPTVTLINTAAIDISKESQQQQQQQQQQHFIQQPDHGDANVVHSKHVVKTFNRVSAFPLPPPPPPPLFPLGSDTETTVISKSGVVGDILNIPIGILRSLQESLGGIGVEKTITNFRN